LRKVSVKNREDWNTNTQDNKENMSAAFFLNTMYITTKINENKNQKSYINFVAPHRLPLSSLHIVFNCTISVTVTLWTCYIILHTSVSIIMSNLVRQTLNLGHFTNNKSGRRSLERCFLCESELKILNLVFMTQKCTSLHGTTLFAQPHMSTFC